MNLRQIGNTDIHVSEVGLGAWQLGNSADWGGPAERESIQLVHRALTRAVIYMILRHRTVLARVSAS